MIDVIAAILLPALFGLGVAALVMSAPLTPSVRLQSALLALIWFAVVSAQGAFGVFAARGSGTIAIGTAILVPIVVSLVAAARFSTFRQVVLETPMPVLVASHAGRSRRNPPSGGPTGKMSLTIRSIVRSEWTLEGSQRGPSGRSGRGVAWRRRARAVGGGQHAAGWPRSSFDRGGPAATSQIPRPSRTRAPGRLSAVVARQRHRRRGAARGPAADIEGFDPGSE